MKNEIEEILVKCSKILASMADESSQSLYESATLIIKTLKKKKKILICGNGGSAADSQHFAAEIVGRFYKNRPALPAIALTTDTSILTAVSNDFGYTMVFARQIEALANEGDVVIGISTSGNSPNIVEALRMAKSRNASTIGMSGASEGYIDEYADISIKIPSSDTPRIQEGHIAAIHILCQLIEEKTFSDD